MIAIVVAVVVFVEQVIVINARIPSPSMENTIMTGDQIFGNRLAYVKSDPQRYDIVIFYYPDDEKQKFIKRVIGLPGETVQIKDGKVYINGKEQKKDIFVSEIEKPGVAQDEITLGENEYFVLGDQASSSDDSRMADIGNVKRSEIYGKIWFNTSVGSNFGFVK